MNLHLKVWRQKNPATKGALVSYEARNIPEDCSFLEMLDLVNEDLLSRGEEPIAFDHDCREGICGMCSLTINGIPHGPSETTTCQLYMRKFKDGQTIYIEPFRASAFPLLRDLAVNHQVGPYLFVHAGIRPGVALDKQTRQDMLWIREPFLSSKADLGVVVVHGHTPRHEPTVKHNRIGIDTGAVLGGALTCVVLEDDKMGFLTS